MLQSSPDLCGITTKNKSSLLVYNHIHTHINTLIQVSLPFKLPLLCLGILFHFSNGL